MASLNWKMSNKMSLSKLILKTPVIGTLTEIASDYVCEGAADFFEKIPPIRCWLKSLGWPIFLSFVLAVLPLPYGFLNFALKIDAHAYEIALAIVPSMLGFGIGAYALVFGLSSDILRKIQNAHVEHAKTTGKQVASVLSINSAFAFPLLIMAATLLLASLHSIFPSNLILSTVVWFLIFFSVVLIYQLVRSLYKLGRVIILEKL